MARTIDYYCRLALVWLFLIAGESPTGRRLLPQCSIVNHSRGVIGVAPECLCEAYVDRPETLSNPDADMGSAASPAGVTAVNDRPLSATENVPPVVTP